MQHFSLKMKEIIQEEWERVKYRMSLEGFAKKHKMSRKTIKKIIKGEFYEKK